MAKVRKKIPEKVKQEVRLESGFRCSIHNCQVEAALQFHHIDEDPSNNEASNILLLCANHHARVTAGEIKVSECVQIKKKIHNEYNVQYSDEQLALMVAAYLQKTSEWPDPVATGQMSMEEIADMLYDELGVRTELIIKKGVELFVFIRAAAVTMEEVKNLFLGVACTLSNYCHVDYISIGHTETLAARETIGSADVIKLWLRFNRKSVLIVAEQKKLGSKFWADVVLRIPPSSVAGPAFSNNIDVKMDEYEARARW